MNGEESEQIGLVNYVVDENQAYEKALEITTEILPQGPIALKMAKNAINRGMEVGNEMILKVVMMLFHFKTIFLSVSG